MWFYDSITCNESTRSTRSRNQKFILLFFFLLSDFGVFLCFQGKKTIQKPRSLLLLLLVVVVVFLFSQNHPFKTYLNYSQVRSFPRHSLELKRQRTVLPLQALFRHLHVGFWIVFISSSIALVRHSSQCLLWWKQTVNSLTQHPRSFLTIWHHDTQWFKLFSRIQHYVAIGSKVLSPTGKIQQSRLFQCQIFISDCEERQDGKMRKTNIPWSNLG